MQDLTWVQNLPEAGGPILRQYREIEWDREEAEKALLAAKLAYKEAMSNIKKQEKALLKSVSSLWTPEEIQQAKDF